MKNNNTKYPEYTSPSAGKCWATSGYALRVSPISFLPRRTGCASVGVATGRGGLSRLGVFVYSGGSVFIDWIRFCYEQFRSNISSTNTRFGNS